MRSKIILVVPDRDSPEVTARCQALGEFLNRLGAAMGQPGEVVTSAADPRYVLLMTTTRAGTVRTDGRLRYVPTLAARVKVAEEADGPWPSAVASRQRKKMRRTPGALFRLPLEPDPARGAGPVEAEAFVTDWTGLPGSCALAVHPAHPLGCGLDPGRPAAFTGRYCRHPLSGDLMPIWAADWVKPDFGTGAVIINPAHNAADLQFARSVGLPVRFALLPDGNDGTPATWVGPPFIKSGVAVRTGIADGQPFDQAKNAYFAAVEGWGLAEPFTDCGVGTFDVGALGDEGTEVGWDEPRGTLAEHAESTVRVTESPVLAVVEDRLRDAELTIIAPSTGIETDLLAVRLLLAEPAFEPAVKEAPEVIVVGNAVSTKEEVAPDVASLAYMVGGAALDTVALKPQQVEPVQRFLSTHAVVMGRESPQGEPSAETRRAAVQIKAQLTAQSVKPAFTTLYRMQKTLAKAESPTSGDIDVYGTLAHVLAGVGGPGGGGTLAARWQQI